MMMPVGDTIWERLTDCVAQLDEPFRASEIVGWFRRHHPDVKEQSLRAHIQGATSNATVESRGPFASRQPLITRIDHGVYRRYSERTTAVAAVAPPRTPSSELSPQRSGTPEPSAETEEWHRESKVQAAVVRHLALEGWEVLSVANTATKEHGLDILARRGDVAVGIEVKGYPSRFYAAAGREGEQKPTQPATQARVWFDSAIVAAMRLRTSQPSLTSVVALPDFPTYRRLASGIAWGLERCEIQLWWVSDAGTVTAP
jgi:Holliday junction resolvase-like predicted endonuclease